MEFIPYQRVTITTDLSKGQVIDRLRERVGQRTTLLGTDRRIFSGRLINDKFDLSLNKNYMNSWTPEITGTITDKGETTEINATLKSSSFVIVGTIIFIIIGLTMLSYEIIGFNGFNNFSWLTLVFPIFIYGLCWFGFNLDADKSIDGLIEITKGELK